MSLNLYLISLVREISIITCKVLVIYRNVSQVCGTNTFTSLMIHMFQGPHDVSLKVTLK